MQLQLESKPALAPRDSQQLRLAKMLPEHYNNQGPLRLVMVPAQAPKELIQLLLA
jgi:hypothetical protein